MPTENCPECKKHNCATVLNYCMWCGYPFNDVMGCYNQKTTKYLQIKADESGQVKLF